MQADTVYETLQHLIDEDIVIGLVSALVTKKSRELFFIGKADEDTMVSVETIYDMASVSKVIGTTTAILKLIEDKKLSLDTLVKSILPAYRHHSTIQDLLTHQSGLPADDKAYRQTHNREEFTQFVYDLELEYTPRTKVVYSDFGFNVLGFIIEHFEGDIESYLQNILFKPLHMHSSTYCPETLDQDLIAPSEMHAERGLIKGIVMDNKALRLNGKSGNAGLFSNINDVSNFVQMLLNGGTLFNKQILKSESIDLLKQSFTLGLDVDRTLGYARKDPSFNQGQQSSDMIIYHTGFTGPSILIDFKREVAIVLLCNRTYPTRENTKILEFRGQLMDAHYQLIK